MTQLEHIQTIRNAKSQIREIWAEVNGEVTDSATLAGLTTVSKYSTWRGWTFILATVSWLVEKLVTEKEVAIEALVEANVGYNNGWITAKLLAFQYNHTLVINELTGKPGYATIDEEAMVVKFVAIELVNGSFYRIKLAGLDENGDKVKLTTDQVNQVNDYLDALILGNGGIAISVDADLAWVRYEIYYSPLYLEVNLRPLVEASVAAYFDDVSFGGRYYETELEAAIKAVPGVIDVRRISVKFKSATGAYSEADRRYTPAAGYIAIDAAYPMADTLIFTKEL
ncbi:MAG: hypothetical protein RIE86_09080 [Imperialibacter sp.]|uniref:hypothetical protein n=1 Tax=Imperialibacter sp. TaxID=2038411 RepID=UPI0032EDBE7A